MTSRIRIFDHYAKPLDELINIPTTPRSWVLNGYARTEFSMSLSDPKVTERILQFGNLVHIEHVPSKDETNTLHGILPDLTGMILTPRTWDFGVIHNTLYSAESILAFRAMPFLTVKGTPKTIFLEILRHANAKAKNIIIQPGQVDDIAMTFSDNLRTNAYDHIQKLCKDAQMDWSVTGQINDKGNLELYANLYSRKGIDTSLTLNNQNTELQSPLLTEQGTISNHVFGYSQAQTQGGRFSTETLDQSSIDDYGNLQLNQTYMGRTDPASIKNASQSRIDKRSRPIKIIKRVALDRTNTFDFLNVGNTVFIKDTGVGFNKNGGFGFESIVKIISMDYNDLSNKCSLNLQVTDAN